MLKIFHTGDIHLGMRFTSYGERKNELIEARFESLENMINISNDLNSDIFVIAGDLFNTITIAKKDITRTIEILERFNGNCVLILPGNHDYDNGNTELWQVFKNEPSEKILCITEEKKYFLEGFGLDIIIYPAPCDNKHSSENRLGWIKDIEDFDEDIHHIGVAHGALEGLSADLEGEYYYMTMNELEDIPMDIWLIGHTHIQYPIGEDIRNHKIYNAGTPEPDGLNFRNKGEAWSIELKKDSIRAKSIETGQYRFVDEDFIIDEEEDLSKIKDFALADKPEKKILRLNLKGHLNEEVYKKLNNFYSELDRKIFHLIIEDNELGIKVDEEIIEKEFTKGSFPYEFLNSLKEDEEALQIAYELLRRN